MNQQSRTLDDVLARAQGKPALRVAVAHPVTEVVLNAVAQAQDAGLISALLVGPRVRVEAAAKACGFQCQPGQIVDVEHSHEAAERACELVANGQAQALMKGSLHTDELLHAVLANPKVRGELRLSHCYVLQHPAYPKAFIVTDAAINIEPNLRVKSEIVRNALRLHQAIWGTPRPRVAVLAAVETVSPEMSATIHAAALSKMAQRGQLGECLVDGPLAFDNAFSASAAREKGIASDVAGIGDIFLVPNLDAGNMLAKELVFLGSAQAAGIVMGARVPIILTSRADSEHTRLLSCAVACLVAQMRESAK